MGYSISWLALRADAEVALSALALRTTGRYVELAGEAPFGGAAMSTGWYLIVADRGEHKLISEPIVQPVSTKVDVVTCWVEEHVMASEASFWSQGRRIWSVSHDAQQGEEHFESNGKLPAFFDEIRASAFADQASKGKSEGVDFIIEVPLEMARRIAGYKHDADGEPARFEVLETTNESMRGRPWWKVW
jgi:hypothetical protein